MKMDKWLPVEQYALKKGVSRQKIYMDIRLGKLKKGKQWKEKKIVKKQLFVKDV